MPCPSVSIVNFELVNAGWVHASNSVVTKWQILEKKLKFWFFPVKKFFCQEKPSQPYPGFSNVSDRIFYRYRLLLLAVNYCYKALHLR